MENKLKTGDLVKIIVHPKYHGQEAVILSVSEGGLYEVIFVSDNLRSLYPLREYELEYISSGYEYVITVRDREIERLKTLNNLQNDSKRID